MNAAPVLIEVYAPVDRDIRATAARLTGRPVTAMGAHRLLRRDLEMVVTRWRAYGAWLERVESGQWYTSWATRRAGWAKRKGA